MYIGRDGREQDRKQKRDEGVRLIIKRDGGNVTLCTSGYIYRCICKREKLH